jgi:hypothetical protein
VAGSFEHDNETSGPVKGGKFLEQLKQFCKSEYTFMVKKYGNISVNTTECESLKVAESRGKI